MLESTEGYWSVATGEKAYETPDGCVAPDFVLGLASNR